MASYLPDFITNFIVDGSETTSTEECETREAADESRNQDHDLENKIEQLTENYNRELEKKLKNAEILHYAKSSTFNETSSPHVSDENLCKESNEQLRYNRELEKKNAEILHYTKSLEEQAVKHQAVLQHKDNQLQECYKRNKGLERQIEVLTESYLASSTFNETSSPSVSDESLCKESNEQLRNHCEIKQLTESYNRELEKKNAEVLHYAKSLEEQAVKHQAVLRHKENQLQEYYKRNKLLEKKIEELTDSKVASLKKMKAERQRMESTYKEQLKSKQKQLDDCRKRLLEEQSKSLRLNQNLKHFASR